MTRSVRVDREFKVCVDCLLELERPDEEAFEPVEVADPTSVRVLARFMGVVQSG